MAAAEQRDAHPIAGPDGQAVQAAGHVFDLVFMHLRRPERHEHQTAGDGVADLADRDLLAERDPGVDARDAVELDDLLAPLLLERRHRLRDGRARAALQHQHIAGNGAGLL